jgi:hypothetical protein
MITHQAVKAGASLGTLQNKSNPSSWGGAGSLPLDKTRSELKVLYRWALQEQIRDILPKKHRINYCLRRTITKDGTVKLMHSPSVNKAHYKNLMTCNNVHVCPLCNSKIMTRRSLELKYRVAESGYKMYMVTFTIQHKKEDKLIDLLRDLSAGIKYLRKNKKYWDALKEDLNILGTITGLEVRYSKKTGWHPHKHVLYIAQKDINKNELKTRILYKYGHYLKTHGYLVNNYTVDVIKTTASDYINKWGIENEITQGTTKESKYSYSPFQLVARGMKKEFLEYANSIKGQRSLVYSNGLKKLLSIPEKSDKELNEYENEDSIKLLSIPQDTWVLITNKKLRGQLLYSARDGNINDVILFLQENSIYL